MFKRLNGRRLACALAVVVALVWPSAAAADETTVNVYPVPVVDILGSAVEVGANPADVVVDGWSWDGT
jgi:ABC-type Fe3+-hydroxamate transport system substrate-binding protein